jgi:hypothetical protein
MKKGFRMEYYFGIQTVQWTLDSQNERIQRGGGMQAAENDSFTGR